MKHSYRPECTCDRCNGERNRRERQADQNAARRRPCAIRTSYGRRNVSCSERRPTPGSQEWAETRGDDIPSYDQPGDDFDI